MRASATAAQLTRAARVVRRACTSLALQTRGDTSRRSAVARGRWMREPHSRALSLALVGDNIRRRTSSMPAARKALCCGPSLDLTP